MNVLIPMAGAGSRFAQVGYTFHKPLIEVRGNPMIQVVVGGLNVDKIKSLGWSPKIGLRQGIYETYEWYKNEQTSNL